MQKIKQTLENLFNKHRIIFWYDDNTEMQEVYDQLDFNRIEKITLRNNEFQVKHRVIREEPGKKFLIYSSESKPINEENWLLDLNLAYHEFSADRASMILQDLGLPLERKTFIRDHIDFFRSKIRSDQFKAIITGDDDNQVLAFKMIAILVNSDPELEKVLYELFSEVDQEKKEKYQDIEKYGFSSTFWKMIKKQYNYASENPTLKDFLIHLFQNRFLFHLNHQMWILNREASIFVNHWMDSAKYQSVFESLSNKIAKQVDLNKTLDDYNFQDLLDCDVYQLIEQRIISELKSLIVTEKIGYQEAMEVVNRRRTSFWYYQYSHIYSALKYALELINLIQTVTFSIDSLKDGIYKYREIYYQFDFAYRKYLYHSNHAEHIDILKDLTEKIENIYSNSYLSKVNELWQKHIDACTDWNISGIPSQKDFFNTFIKPYVKAEKKVFVIISDGLRYETAVELNDLLIQENMYQSELSILLGQLPSYTQLGMAALLPHRKLSYNNESAYVFIDDNNSSGIPNRTKILQKNYSQAVAIQAEDLLKMNRDQGREFVKQWSIFYIYHNGIDATGDNAKSESEVFEATEKEFEIIKKVIRQIINFNGTNIIITSDHGYIYQNRALDESDFCKVEKLGKVFFSNRRCIVGKELYESKGVKKFTAKQLGIDDDTEFLLAKSINRIKVQGGGSRYVHGGSSLQEVVLPLIQFNKRRKSDISKVDVDIIKSHSKITTNQISISLIQTQPIEEKVLTRELKIGFYAKDGEPLSDEAKMIFNSESPDARNREQKHRFVFKSNAREYNNQNIYLRLLERIEGTNQYRTYKEDVYTLLISFASEFDDF